MHRSTSFLVLGSILLLVNLFFALTPAASTAFAATTGTHRASSVSTLTHTTSSRLAPDACPPSCANPINMCPPTQQEGNSNTWVRVIKFRLNELFETGAFLDSPNSFSFPLTTSDPIFTSILKNAVVDFQDAVGIGASGGGAVGDRTWSAMGFCLGFSHIILGDSETTSLTNCPPDQSNGGSDNMTFVEAIQALLNIDFNFGFFPNSPNGFQPFLAFDGAFGPKTQNAVNDFQIAVGISGGGGAVGQRTWSELGMCFNAL